MPFRTIRHRNKPHNPKWCAQEQFREKRLGVDVTEFERKAQDLNLSPEQYRMSAALKAWVKANCNHRYVPEALLSHWGFEPRVSFKPNEN